MAASMAATPPPPQTSSSQPPSHSLPAPLPTEPPAARALHALSAIWPSSASSPEAQALRFAAEFMLRSARWQDTGDGGFPLRTISMGEVGAALAAQPCSRGLTWKLKELLLSWPFFKVTGHPDNMLTMDVAALLRASGQAVPSESVPQVSGSQASKGVNGNDFFKLTGVLDHRHCHPNLLARQRLIHTVELAATRGCTLCCALVSQVIAASQPAPQDAEVATATPAAVTTTAAPAASRPRGEAEAVPPAMSGEATAAPMAALAVAPAAVPTVAAPTTGTTSESFAAAAPSASAAAAEPSVPAVPATDVMSRALDATWPSDTPEGQVLRFAAKMCLAALPMQLTAGEPPLQRTIAIAQLEIALCMQPFRGALPSDVSELFHGCMCFKTTQLQGHSLLTLLDTAALPSAATDPAGPASVATAAEQSNADAQVCARL